MADGGSQRDQHLSFAVTAGVDFGEGTVEGTAISLQNRMSPTARGVEQVHTLKRRYRVDGDVMNYEVDMGIDRQPLAQHVSAQKDTPGARSSSRCEALERPKLRYSTVMYRFVCKHVVPGCTFELEDPDREKLEKEAAAHLREHHDLDHRDERIAEALRSGGIGFFRQA